MEAINYAAEIVKDVKELQRSVEQIAEALAVIILQSNKVLVAGAGRSSLMGRVFAMSLMHTGINAYVVGETVTPGIDKGDVLISGTGSGKPEA